MLARLVLHGTSGFVNDCLIFSNSSIGTGLAGFGAIVADVDGDGVGGGGSGVDGVIDGNENDGVGDVISRSACIEPAEDFFDDKENDRKSV